ncbi:MAG: hypothetical protein JWQ11_4571 [Rhizobacter sp.]|nr:hypothetical protein [Rhizobacter sp.]
MAKQYEDFKKTFADIEKKTDEANEEIGKNVNFVAQTSGIISEGAKEVGLRVQQLKDGGMKGTTIADFKDPEIKKYMTAIDEHMSGLEKELKRIAVVHAGLMQKTEAAYVQLKKDLVAEIAARKKDVSTKLGTGNKSLPDMEKLLVTLNKYGNGASFLKMTVFQPEKIAEHRSQLDSQLTKQLKQTKELALSAEQQMLDEQALNIRNLIGNVARAKTLCEAVMKSCTAAEKALVDKNQKALMAAKLEVPKPLKALGDLANIGERALKDDWIKSKIKDSKDKAKILAGIKSIADYKTNASDAVKKIANAKL